MLTKEQSEKLKKLINDFIPIRYDFVQQDSNSKFTHDIEKVSDSIYCEYEKVSEFKIQLNQKIDSITETKPAHCVWHPAPPEWEDDRDYITECFQCFSIISGTLEENEMKYCPYCGKLIKLQEDK